MRNLTGTELEHVYGGNGGKNYYYQQSRSKSYSHSMAKTRYGSYSKSASKAHCPYYYG